MSLSRVEVESLPSVTDMTYDAVKRAILGGDFAPGDQLVESRLAADLGVSTTPVRDALARLEQEGLLRIVPFRGAFVREPSLDDAIEIFELRQIIDGMLAAIATERLSDEDLAAGQRLLDEADGSLESGDREQCVQLGAQFHHLLQRRARRDRLSTIVQNLEQQCRLVREVSISRDGRLEQSSLEHRRVLEALMRRDAVAAEMAMREHHRSFLTSLVHNNTRKDH